MTEATTHNRPLIEQNLEYFGNEIQRLMSDFPCLREICKGLETAAYPAALFTGACFLGTLMTRCTYRFYHRPEELRRLNYGVYIIGDPGSGKSFATRLYNLLAGPIIRVSNQGMNAMNRYKRKYSEWEHSGQKGDGPTKPKPLIRVHPARNSNKVFIEDMNNAIDIVDGEEMHLHMLSFDTELSNSIRLQSEAWNSKQIMELKAFHNEEDGECFVNSLLQPAFNVYWNYVYTGTPMALETKVNQRNIGTGLATRLAAIPMPSTHFRMMKRETLEEVGLEPEEDKTLRMWAERLDKEYGELPIEKLVGRRTPVQACGLLWHQCHRSLHRHAPLGRVETASHTVHRRHRSPLLPTGVQHPTLLPELLLRQLLGVVFQDAGAGIQWSSTRKALLKEDEGALPFAAQ